MEPLALASLLVLLDVGAGERAQKALAAAAAASPRPAECAPSASARGRELWERARSQRVEAYCAALARGFARLARDPAAALNEAVAAEKAFPGQITPRLLKGRALLRTGEIAEAHGLLRALVKDRPDALADPGALHDLALASLRLGRLGEALEEYRTLVPRAELLEDARERYRVFVEAGALAMALGPANLSEALGYLGEARRAGVPPGFADLTLGLLALALDRAGRPEQARALAREASGPWATERVLGESETAERAGDEEPRTAGKATAQRAQAALVPAPVLVEGELDAVVAMLAERVDVRLARARWTAFLDGSGGKGPWAEHARKKLAALGVERKGGGV